MNNVTLQDVAQAAGVSLATVSRALHGGYVSAEKRRRIEEAVHTLRYIPNQSAAALKRNRSRTIGHLMHFHDNLLASRVNAGLARAAHERGYSLFSVTSNGGGEDSRRMAEELISRRMDGMVVTSCRELPAETTAHLAEVGIPTVLIERWAPGAMGDRIRIDDVAGARCAVAQRLAAGRKRVAFIGCGDFSQEVERQRLWGYREALESAGVPEEIRLIRLTEDYTPEEGRRAMEALLESGGCDAVFCASDLFGRGGSAIPLPAKHPRAGSNRRHGIRQHRFRHAFPANQFRCAGLRRNWPAGHGAIVAAHGQSRAGRKRNHHFAHAYRKRLKGVQIL